MQRLQELKHEFEKIVGKLDSLVEQEMLTSFDRRLIMEISEDVLQELARKYDIMRLAAMCACGHRHKAKNAWRRKST